MGANPLTRQPSNLITATFNEGNAGTLRIDTARLTVQDGGTVNGGTAAAGNAGSVIINASESVELGGSSFGAIPTSVSSAGEVAEETLRQVARLPDIPTGDSGDVIINTPRLIVRDQAVLNVRNLGTGQAGTLQVNADAILVADAGSISATTLSGEGGNIVLQTQNLQLRRAGQVTATAGGTGNGGNLTVNAGAIAALENSEISAKAVRGRGGNIQITTSGFFRSEDSPVTATSQFGLAGAVQLTTPNFDPSSGLVDLQDNVGDASALIGQIPCQDGGENTFTIVGKGGLPARPDDPFNGFGTLSEWSRGTGQVDPTLEKLPRSSAPRVKQQSQETENFSGTLVEATNWTQNAEGQVMLTTRALNSDYSPGLTPLHCR